MRFGRVFLLCCLSFVFACGSGKRRDRTDTDYTITFSSCLSQFGDTSLWNTIAREGSQLFLFTGDTIYADTLDLGVKRSSFARLNADKNYRNFKKNTRVLAVWDDHDYGYNDAGGSYRMKSEMQRIFLDAFDEPQNSPRRKQEGIYAAEELNLGGRVIQIIVLDVRYFRTDWSYGPKVPPFSRTYVEDNRETSTMLGAPQWRWLAEQIERPADLRILVSSTPVLSDDYLGERWGAFPKERARLYREMAGTKTGKWLIVTGDRHFAQILEVKNVLPYTLTELTASGMNTVWEDGSQFPDRLRVGQTIADYNYGTLRIDSKNRSVAYSLHGSDGMAKLTGKLDF
ncbi:MAG: alkaline phosphatase D family protein [Turneriella sp.]